MNQPSYSLKTNPIRWVILIIILLFAACQTDPASPDGSPSDQSASDPTPIPAEPITAENAGQIAIQRALNISDGKVSAVAASPRDPEFATLSRDRIVRLWSGVDGAFLGEIGQVADYYGAGLAYSPDGELVAVTGGYHVYLWDVSSTIQVHDVVVNSRATQVAWSADGGLLAVVGKDSSKVEIIDVASGAIVDAIPSPSRKVMHALAYSPDGKLLAASDSDGLITVLDPETRLPVFEDTQANRGYAQDLVYSPDGSLLASCHVTGGVYIWDTSNWSIVLAGDRLFGGSCVDGMFSPGSDVYFAGGADGYLQAWSMLDGSLLLQLEFPAPIVSISVAGDGRFVVVAIDESTAYLVGIGE